MQPAGPTLHHHTQAHWVVIIKKLITMTVTVTVTVMTMIAIMMMMVAMMIRVGPKLKNGPINK